MFKWFKKWLKRRALKKINYRVCIREKYSSHTRFFLYYPYSSLVYDLVKISYLESRPRFLIISDDKVFLQFSSMNDFFQEVVDEDFKKQLLNAHNNYVTQLQEIELM